MLFSQAWALAGITVFGTWMFPAFFWWSFFASYNIFWEVSVETHSRSLDKRDRRMDLDTNLLEWSTANQSEL